jgi:hypothetical protein
MSVLNSFPSPALLISQEPQKFREQRGILIADADILDKALFFGFPLFSQPFMGLMNRLKW